MLAARSAGGFERFAQRRIFIMVDTHYKRRRKSSTSVNPRLPAESAINVIFIFEIFQLRAELEYMTRRATSRRDGVRGSRRISTPGATPCLRQPARGFHEVFKIRIQELSKSFCDLCVPSRR